jgi:hypothetical protein
MRAEARWDCWQPARCLPAAGCPPPPPAAAAPAAPASLLCAAPQTKKRFKYVKPTADQDEEAQEGGSSEPLLPRSAPAGQQ